MNRAYTKKAPVYAIEKKADKEARLAAEAAAALAAAEAAKVAAEAARVAAEAAAAAAAVEAAAAEERKKKEEEKKKSSSSSHGKKEKTPTKDKHHKKCKERTHPTFSDVVFMFVYLHTLGVSKHIETMYSLRLSTYTNHKYYRREMSIRCSFSSLLRVSALLFFPLLFVNICNLSNWAFVWNLFVRVMLIYSDLRFAEET